MAIQVEDFDFILGEHFKNGAVIQKISNLIWAAKWIAQHLLPRAGIRSISPFSKAIKIDNYRRNFGKEEAVYVF